MRGRRRIFGGGRRTVVQLDRGAVDPRRPAADDVHLVVRDEPGEGPEAEPEFEVLARPAHVDRIHRGSLPPKMIKAALIVSAEVRERGEARVG